MSFDPRSFCTCLSINFFYSSSIFFRSESLCHLILDLVYSAIAV
jgi:hypothetical protein